MPLQVFRRHTHVWWMLPTPHQWPLEQSTTTTTTTRRRRCGGGGRHVSHDQGGVLPRHFAGTKQGVHTPHACEGFCIENQSTRRTTQAVNDHLVLGELDCRRVVVVVVEVRGNRFHERVHTVFARYTKNARRFMNDNDIIVLVFDLQVLEEEQQQCCVCVRNSSRIGYILHHRGGRKYGENALSPLVLTADSVDPWLADGPCYHLIVVVFVPMSTPQIHHHHWRGRAMYSSVVWQ